MLDDEAQRLANEAAPIWGGTGTPELIRNRENAVFDATLPAGRAALRIHRRGYQTEDAIRSELWWMEALADAGLPVPRPIRASDDALVARLADGRFASALAWIDGAAIGTAGAPLPGNAADQARLHHALGYLLGEMHAATDRLRLPPAFHRPRWDIDGLVGAQPFWGRFWAHPALDPVEVQLLSRARDWAAGRLADYAATGGDQGLIHADVLRENVLASDGTLWLIDFDDSGFGFRLYDLGTALSQNLDEPHLPEICAALVEGYAARRPLSAADRAMVPVFTLLRCLASVGWTLPRLPGGDPRHRSYIDRALRLAQRLLDGGGLAG
jgi:Ser/Thr protein kinase RdoA (MazF antagonist)